ncbi:hypothetical protein V2J09_012384 [Rumex salicifolius]
MTNTIRSLLFHTHLPATFWTEALHTATHTLNLLPTSTRAMSTPHELLYHNSPTYDHLRLAYLLIYVDDIILTASTMSFMKKIICALTREFAMSHLGSLRYFLGVLVKPLDNGIHLSQEQYALDILVRADRSSCNPCRTPVDTNPKLSSNAGEAVADPTEYRSLAGSLQYLCFTRPDICYAVQQCCLHLHDPRGEHLLALKRILRYIKGTSQLGLSITPNSDERLTTYSDADWAGCSIIFGNLTRIFPTYSFHCMCFDLLLLPSAHAPPELGIGILLFFFFSFDLHWLIWATNLWGLWLTLPNSASKCISEEIRSNVIVLVDYYVLGADDLKERDISVKVHISTDHSKSFSNSLHGRHR